MPKKGAWLDNSVLLRRKDNLYEVGACLMWEFVPTWTPQRAYACALTNPIDGSILQPKHFA